MVAPRSSLCRFPPFPQRYQFLQFRALGTQRGSRPRFTQWTLKIPIDVLILVPRSWRSRNSARVRFMIDVNLIGMVKAALLGMKNRRPVSIALRRTESNTFCFSKQFQQEVKSLQMTSMFLLLKLPVSFKKTRRGRRCLSIMSAEHLTQ